MADGIRFNFHAIGTGNYFSLNVHEGDDRSTPEYEGESYTYDWIDDADGWVVIEVLFSDLTEDPYQSEYAVVDGFDGTAVQSILIGAFGAGFFVIEGIAFITGP